MINLFDFSLLKEVYIIPAKNIKHMLRIPGFIQLLRIVQIIFMDKNTI